MFMSCFQKRPLAPTCGRTCFHFLFLNMKTKSLKWFTGPISLKRFWAYLIPSGREAFLNHRSSAKINNLDPCRFLQDSFFFFFFEAQLIVLFEHGSPLHRSTYTSMATSMVSVSCYSPHNWGPAFRELIIVQQLLRDLNWMIGHAC